MSVLKEYFLGIEKEVLNIKHPSHKIVYRKMLPMIKIVENTSNVIIYLNIHVFSFYGKLEIRFFNP